MYILTISLGYLSAFVAGGLAVYILVRLEKSCPDTRTLEDRSW